MGCGGSKSTAVSQNDERSPLMERDAKDESRKETEQDGTSENHSPGYSKLPQDDGDKASPQEATSSEQPDMSMEENNPAEKTTTRYTKLPPMSEDKDVGEKGATDASKPDQIAEEDEEVEDPAPKGVGGEQAEPEE